MISTVSLGQDTQDTTIKLPKPVAREIAKDLIRYDSTTTEMGIIKKNYDLEKNNSITKDSIINLKNQQLDLWKKREDGWNSIDSLRKVEIDVFKSDNKKLAKDLKKVKRQKTLWQIGLSVLAVGFGYLSVK
jgi:hypothetical protein